MEKNDSPENVKSSYWVTNVEHVEPIYGFKQVQLFGAKQLPCPEHTDVLLAAYPKQTGMQLG